MLAANLVAFFEFGRWLDLFAPLLALLALYAIVVLYKYFIGERQERRIRAAFKHYLSPALVEQVAREPELLRLGGEQKELTVLFADIRNSTGIGAKLPPEVFIGLLNEVLDSMTDVLFAHDGMLDKYTGDGLVAVFGAPLPQPDHALRACRAALAMLDQLAPVRARWARPDLPPVEIGIGINTGPMIIGNMGSKERFAYTVIGDEANLGARLEAANKDFQTHILISEATWQAVKGEIAARELDVVTFRGMARPVRVYEVLGTYPLAADAARRLAAFESGLAAWRHQRWPEAKGWFEQVLALAPGDRPSQIYLERCRDRLAGRPEATPPLRSFDRLLWRAALIELRPSYGARGGFAVSPAPAVPIHLRRRQLRPSRRRTRRSGWSSRCCRRRRGTARCAPCRPGTACASGTGGPSARARPPRPARG